MSTTVTQLPGELNVVASAVDDLTLTLTFPTSIAGNGYAAAVFSTLDSSPEVTPMVVVTNAAAGQLKVLVTAAQMMSLADGKAYRWYLRQQSPGGQYRAMVSGRFVSRVP